MPAKAVQQVIQDHTRRLIALPGVMGLAQGLVERKPCIKVYVVERTPQVEQEIPESLEGYAVVVEETQLTKS